ncbi:Six-hairpin glycosidase [Aspergillus sclerotioniger CBS 115572]|uniref:Six-hairpin glycosidase n=1 Tax=Aspergillus sclerotioniger CBS 115572 TaxID=1450535 RepID=A0A317UZY0_9EURO|nr:Six-hairpin glycosidase [Aspergillus sclerotioniger CBS 115572]PWY67614.1 Six-hairpin glycosidase [Aspergillus sclerotioniger CBS 115572]
MVTLTAFLLLEAASIVAGAPTQVSNDSSTSFLANAKAGVTTLQTWYNQSTGLWDTTGWWNSANCLTVLGDLTALDSSLLNSSAAIFNNTFLRAPISNLGQSVWKSNASKPLPPTGVIETQGFINEYYDDEAWWALGWIQAYDLTHDQRYLDTAADIFEDMTTGWNATCGGVWWDKSHTQNGAIENELFLSVAAHLGRRIPSNASYYRDWAMKEWTWFQNSGMINAENTINNGLDLTTCRNDNGTVWSYNQGVILGGLVELSKLVGNTSYISTAQKIADAAIQALSDSDGVLIESCEPDCTGDAPQFKGVFMRNLQALYQASPEDGIKEFLETNANSIWQNDQGKDSELGDSWSGPLSNADATTQSSACDALVAAASL